MLLKELNQLHEQHAILSRKKEIFHTIRERKHSDT